MDLLNEVKEYFADSDHWRRLCSSLQDPDPWGTHIHAYVETSVHPEPSNSHQFRNAPS